jgi:hypothetical protein
MINMYFLEYKVLPYLYIMGVRNGVLCVSHTKVKLCVVMKTIVCS